MESIVISILTVWQYIRAMNLIIIEPLRSDNPIYTPYHPAVSLVQAPYAGTLNFSFLF